MLVKHYPTFMGVGQCLISVGLCWMLEFSNDTITTQQCWIFVAGPMILITQAKLLNNVG